MIVISALGITVIETSRTLARSAFRSLGVGSAVASIAGGTAAGQLVLAVALPAIAYLYSAADLGLFAILIGYGEIAAIVVTARLEQVLPRLPAGRRWTAVHLLTRSTVVLAPIAAVAIASLAGMRWANPWHVVGLTLFVVALVSRNLSNYAVLATKDYRRAGLHRGLSGATTAAAQVAGGLIAPSFMMLMLAYAAANMAAALISIPALRAINQAHGGEPNEVVVREERLVRFRLSVGSGDLLSNLSLTLPLVGLSILFGNAAAGSFWLARRVLTTQTTLIATAVSDATYAMTTDWPPGRIAALVWSRLRKLRLSAVLVLALGLIAAPILARVTGDDYDNIAIVVLLLTPAAMLQFVTIALSKAFLAMHMEHVRTFWHAGRLAGLFAVFWLSRLEHLSFVTTVAVLALYMAIAYGILLALLARGAHQLAKA